MKKIIVLVVSISLLSTCKKNTNNENCFDLLQAIKENDIEVVKREINKMAIAFVPAITATDPHGHQQNITKLANKINEQCGISAVVFCYACIQTLPEQSEIEISFMHNGILVHKKVDITTNINNRLVCINMHD